MSTSLMEWIWDLMQNPDARAEFDQDPQGYAHEHGFDNLSAADVHDALQLIADSGSYSHHDHGAHIAPPPPYHHDHGDNGAAYLKTYVTNNYTTVEDHSTNVDNSVHQNIDTDGGDFHQAIDNDPVVASGDGAVAAGGDIRDSNVTHGDGNVVGDGNHVVTGHDNTTAFGSGDASNASFDHVNVDHGGSMSVSGDSSGYSSDDDTHLGAQLRLGEHLCQRRR